MLADPDFDLSPADVRAEAKRLLGRAAERAGEPSPPAAWRLGKVMRLPGTAAEVKAITPSLKAYAGEAPRVFTGKQALTAVYRSARSPRVLRVPHPGLLLPRAESAAREGQAWRSGVGESAGARGLLLAGCNNGKGAEGVLTGSQVLEADLSGTELVVLSADDTGLGDVQVGEGVSGLRQAFQLAGARAVVSALRQVPDRQSAQAHGPLLPKPGEGPEQVGRTTCRQVDDDRGAAPRLRRGRPSVFLGRLHPHRRAVRSAGPIAVASGKLSRFKLAGTGLAVSRSPEQTEHRPKVQSTHVEEDQP